MEENPVKHAVFASLEQFHDTNFSQLLFLKDTNHNDDDVKLRIKRGLGSLIFHGIVGLTKHALARAASSSEHKHEDRHGIFKKVKKYLHDKKEKPEETSQDVQAKRAFFQLTKSVKKTLDMVNENNRLLNQNAAAIAANGKAIEVNSKKLDRNYGAIKSLENDMNHNFAIQLDHIKEIEHKLDFVLESIEVAKEDILARIDSAKEAILQSVMTSRIAPICSHLNAFLSYFIGDFRELISLSVPERIVKLESGNNILDFLEQSRLPEVGTLHTLLSDIINENFAVPTGEKTDTSEPARLAMLEFLSYGTHLYSVIPFFLMEQYDMLAQYYYHKNDIEKYNQYYLLIFKTFRDFYNTLAVKNAFFDKVILVLNKVKNLYFVQEKLKDTADFIEESLFSLELAKEAFANTDESLNLELIDRLDVRLDFSESNIKTPILQWKDGSQVSYAIQYLNTELNVTTLVSEWSRPYTIKSHALPVVVNLPKDPSGRTKIIFRRFDEKKPEIAAILTDPTVTEFRDINRDLFNAALELNEEISLEQIKLLISYKADVNAAFEKDKRAIHIAVENAHLNVTKELLKGGSEINVKDQNGYSPIYIATNAGHLSMIRFLLEHKANVNVKTSKAHFELTPLHNAIYKNRKKIIQLFLKSKDIDLNAKAVNGLSSLHFAASVGNADIVKMLIADARTEVDIRSDQLLTPLHLASVNGHDKVVAILLQTGKVNINAQANDGSAPLHLAAIYGSTKTVTMLVAKGANLAIANANGSTPLHYAMFKGNNEIITKLAHNSETYNNEQTDQEITPLYLAYHFNNTKAQIVLTSHCANKDLRFSNNKTMMHIAASSGNADTVSSLIANEFAVNDADISKWQPIHYAVMNGHRDVVQILLKHGADVNAKGEKNQTPLHLAAKSESSSALQMVKLLVDAGASTANKCLQLRTPLFYAIDSGNVNIVKYLVEKYADVSVKDKDGFTLVNWAAKQNKFDIAQVLIEKGANFKDGNEYKCKYNKEDNNDYVCKVVFKDISDLISYNLTDWQFTPLHYAAFNGNVEFTRYLIGKGADLKAANVNNEWPIVSAVYGQGNREVVDLFLSSGIEKNFRYKPYHEDEIERNLASVAAKANKFELLKYLWSIKVDWNGHNILYFAAQSGNDKLMKLAMDYGFDGLKEENVRKYMNTKHTPYDHSITPLGVAAANKLDFECLMYMIARHADINATYYPSQSLCSKPVNSFKDGTILNAAIIGNNTEFAKYLIDKNIKVSKKTDLSLAADNNNYFLVDYLLKEGVDINKINCVSADRISLSYKYCGTALNYIIKKNGQLDMVKYLVSKNASLQVKYHERDGDVFHRQNPLYNAIMHNKLDIAKYLIEKGADLNEKGHDQSTPLHAAVLMNNLELFLFLVGKGANVTDKNRDKLDPIELAVMKNKENILRHYLFKYKNKFNKSALHEAAEKGEQSRVKYLLQRGANYNALDARNSTPLHLAAQNGHLEVVKLLSKQRCIRLGNKNIAGQTAIAIAKYGNQKSVVLFLEERLNSTGQLKHSAAQANVNGTLLLLSVMAHKKTGQKYIATNSTQVDTAAARAYALNITERFEKLLDSLAKSGVKVAPYDQFKLYQQIEKLTISEKLDTIEQHLNEIAKDAVKNKDPKVIKQVSNDIHKLFVEVQNDHENSEAHYTHYSPQIAVKGNSSEIAPIGNDTAKLH